MKKKEKEIKTIVEGRYTYKINEKKRRCYVPLHKEF